MLLPTAVKGILRVMLGVETLSTLNWALCQRFGLGFECYMHMNKENAICSSHPTAICGNQRYLLQLLDHSE